MSNISTIAIRRIDKDRFDEIASRAQFEGIAAWSLFRRMIDVFEESLRMPYDDENSVKDTEPSDVKKAG